MSDKIMCLTNEAGSWVKWEDYTRLKAEVERLRASSFVTAVPVEQYEKLKAEVERLEAEVKRLNVEVDILRASSFVTAVSVEQYERLREAGDEVLREWSSGDEKDARNFMKALVVWNAAKEGKQP